MRKRTFRPEDEEIIAGMLEGIERMDAFHQDRYFDYYSYGWNVRCNLCGSFGAVSINNARPGWGVLYVCLEHLHLYKEEQRRHNEAMKLFRDIKFENYFPDGLNEEAIRRSVQKCKEERPNARQKKVEVEK